MRAIVAFYQIQYRLGKIDEAYLDAKVAANKISADEKIEIMG